VLRKNVSLSDAHLKLLDPLLKKHQGNLSAAMRDIIDFTGFVTQNMGSLETAKDLLKEKNHAREQTRNRIYGVTIPLTIFRWLLANRKSGLPPLSDTNQLFLPHNANIYDIKGLDRIINEVASFLNWPVNVSVGSEGGQISLQITGMDTEINKFVAAMIAMFLANNKNPHKISKLMIYPASIYIQLSDAASHEEAVQSIQEIMCDEANDIIGRKNDLILSRA
jgi:hypothetical protein